MRVFRPLGAAELQFHREFEAHFWLYDGISVKGSVTSQLKRDRMMCVAQCPQRVLCPELSIREFALTSRLQFSQ